MLLGLALGACQRQTAVPLQTFDTRANAAFGDATVPLRLFLEKRSEVALQKPQHFCVVGTSTSGSGAAWVHWKEGNLLILWEPGDEYQIARSRRKLDLAQDIVATEADVKGSTYLVTRAWADAVMSSCEQHGAQYTVEKVNTNG
jgi:hypothetical protein